MQSLLKFFRSVGPVNKDGYKFIAIFFMCSVVIFFISTHLSILFLGLTVWCILFFRDPVRIIPVGEQYIICPADGIVSDISEKHLPKELGMELNNKKGICVSIFMNVFNCHVNRSPIKGVIDKMHYVPGKFLSADIDKASEENERQIYHIKSNEYSCVIVQIAGLIARRIVPFTHEGAHLLAGQRIGLIRFGSRVDLYLPEGIMPQIAVGQKTIAGETIIADMNKKKQTLIHTRFE